jgi:hypothetical protein
LACIVFASAVTACGGGGGGGDGGGGGNPPTGQIAATVVDQFDAPINAVTITATIGSTTRTATTGADGTATVTQVPTGAVSVTASAEGLVDPPAQTVTVNADATATVSFEMERVVEATGGISRAVADGALSGDGSSFTFRLRVIVIDQNFNPVPGLTVSAFTLADCEPVTPEFPERPDCVRSSSGGFDAAYTVANATPASFAVIDPTGPVPYAAGLLFDSSDSIRDTDPTDARIFATKEFLNDIGSGDLVMLAAFADGADSLLPDPPLTYYPCATAPCTPQFTTDGNSLFASLDSLATVEGGGTPLYDSLEEMVITVDDTAPTTPANLRQAAVLFSDGKDIYCAEPPGSFQFCTQRREDVVTLSEQRLVDIFTIGLSDNVDSLAMAELALRNGGAYMFAERTTQLIPIFGVLGRLLSNSLPSYEMVWTVNAAAATLAPGRAVIGRLTVDTGSATFALPFVVQIEQP